MSCLSGLTRSHPRQVGIENEREWAYTGHDRSRDGRGHGENGENRWNERTHSLRELKPHVRYHAFVVIRLGLTRRGLRQPQIP